MFEKKKTFPPSEKKHLLTGCVLPSLVLIDMQGGIPQCSELLARYIAQLISSKVKLPRDFRDAALVEGRCEAEGFHVSRNNTVLVDYAPYMLALSRLVGCEPAVPGSLDGMVKFWTFPLWSCL